MGILCVYPAEMNEVNQNYARAQRYYQIKREAIIKRVKEQYNLEGNEFIKQIQGKIRDNMGVKKESDLTHRTVGIETILKHLYKAVEASAYSVVEDQKDQIDSLAQEIKSLQIQAIDKGKKEKEKTEKEIDVIVAKYAKDMQLNSMILEYFGKYFPDYMSKDNLQLSFSQVYSYAKSILKNEAFKRINQGALSQIIKKHPAIIKGYIQEDAVGDGSNKVIEELKMSSASARVVGSEKSKIDILISLTEQAASKSSSPEALKEILNKLDSISGSFTVEGESQLDTDEFIGIQSKPWRLYLKTTDWNRNSVGSRKGLLDKFKQSQSIDNVENKYSWHSGVLFLSNYLDEVIGTNTTLYAIDNQLIWTDQLFEQIRNYNKYFSFMLNSKHKLTSHVQLSEHTD